jgi:molybdopterin-guanine dinucleotide biosynthesis protein A
MQEQIERSQLQIRVFLERVSVRYVEAAEIDSFDPGHLSFFNVNTPDDLKRARGMVAETRNR